MKENQLLENYSFQEETTEFDEKIFKGSNFSKVNLGSFEFIDCTFISCDLSMARLENAVFTRVKFIQCKLLGVDFSLCSTFAFSVSFEDCILNYCVFLKNNLKKTIFNKCIIKEASFFDTDLTSASFIECDLSEAIFERNNLSKCDFRTAYNYDIIPSENNIKKAMFSLPGVVGLLGHLNIIIEQG